MKHLLAISFLLFSTLAWAATPSAPDAWLKEQSLLPGWLRLLHYKANLFGGWTSEIDAPVFFLARDGKTNPEAELRATIEAFQNPENLNSKEQDSPLCRFPARLLYLGKKLKASGIPLQLPERSCPHFENWISAVSGDSLSLVFSSYYLNNPSSTYGHTFIRINKSANSEGKRFELLDYGFNFAANMNTENPLVYAFKGLFGGFIGTFTNIPYYYKVREYNNAESRDLWEYELNFSKEKTDLFARHFWEVGPTFSDYYYFTVNCSYFMLALMESADPDLDLTNRTKKYVIPSDTVKVVMATPGLVKSVHYRPSVRSQFFTRLNKLDEKEKANLKTLLLDKRSPEELKNEPAPSQVKVLDAAIDGLDFLHPIETQKNGSKEWAQKNQILAARSVLPAISDNLIVPEPKLEEPDAGHGTRRMSAGYASSSKDFNKLDFGYKFALHDFLDPLRGYPEYAQIAFFDLNMAWLDKYKRFRLEELNLFETLSLNPLQTYATGKSWGMKFSFGALRNEQCFGCESTTFEGRTGYSWLVPVGQKAVLFAGVRGQLTSTGGEQLRAFAGAGPDLLLRLRWTEFQQTLLEGFYRKDYKVRYDEYKELSLSHQWSFSEKQGIRIKAETTWFENSGGLDYVYYY